MQADFSLDCAGVMVERPQKVYLMAKLAAGPIPIDQERRPLNLSLVIDRSGSMAGNKIEYTQQAAAFLVQNLSPRDRFSIVLYNDQVQTLLKPGRVTQKDHIIQKIKAIKAGGTTNLSGGWLTGCTLVAENLADDHLNRVILISDGLANRGITETPKLVAAAQQKREERVTTTTMGLGEEFNEDLLMALADAGGGAYYFIESPDVTPTIFQEELQGLLNVVGQNLIITLEATEYVEKIKQLNNYPFNTTGDEVTFQVGDIFGEEEKTLILELTIPPLKETGQRRIATLRFAFDEIQDNQIEHRVLELPIMLHVVPAGGQPKPINREVQQAVLLLQAAQARRKAVNVADQGDYAAAAQMLRDIAEAIAESGLDSVELAEEQAALEQQAADLDRGAAAYDQYSRKSMTSQSYYTLKSHHEGTVMMRARERARQEQAAVRKTVKRQEGVTPAMLTWNDRLFRLEGDLIRIGRSHHNEIVIDAKGISRFHCQIRRKGDKLILEDLGSTNGTLIDGVPLTSPHILSAGDQIQLSDETLVFHI